MSRVQIFVETIGYSLLFIFLIAFALWLFTSPIIMSDGKYVGKDVSISISQFDTTHYNTYYNAKISLKQGPAYAATCMNKKRSTQLLCEKPVRTVSGKQETLPDLRIDFRWMDDVELLWPDVVRQQMLHRAKTPSEKTASAAG